jgi:mono/diheme cytochrome c family protein
MFRIPRAFVLTLLVPAFLLPSLALAADGKAVFLDKKCNKCHAVSSAAIEKTSKLKGPDLTVEPVKSDVKLLKSYLRKQETINGKKHGTGFTGTDDELDAVLAWVLQQNKGKK